MIEDVEKIRKHIEDHLACEDEEQRSDRMVLESVAERLYDAVPRDDSGDVYDIGDEVVFDDTFIIGDLGYVSSVPCRIAGYCKGNDTVIVDVGEGKLEYVSLTTIRRPDPVCCDGLPFNEGEIVYGVNTDSAYMVLSLPENKSVYCKRLKDGRCFDMECSALKHSVPYDIEAISRNFGRYDRETTESVLREIFENYGIKIG